MTPFCIVPENADLIADACVRRAEQALSEANEPLGRLARDPLAYNLTETRIETLRKLRKWCAEYEALIDKALAVQARPKLQAAE